MIGTLLGDGHSNPKGHLYCVVFQELEILMVDLGSVGFFWAPSCFQVCPGHKVVKITEVVLLNLLIDDDPRDHLQLELLSVLTQFNFYRNGIGERGRVEHLR